MTTATKKKTAKKPTDDKDDGPEQLVLKTEVVEADDLEFAPRGARGSKWAAFVREVLELEVGSALKIAVPVTYKPEQWRNRVSNVIYNRITKPGHAPGFRYGTRVTVDGKFVAVVCSKAEKE